MKKTIKKCILCFVLITFVFILCSCEKKSAAMKNDYFVLVNKYSQLPDYWEDNLELVDAKNAWDEDIKVEKKAYKQFVKLKKEVDKALKEYNTTIELDSVYRSVKAQQELWDDWSNDPEKGIDYVKKFVAVPGFSEHHTGLAIDICLKKDGELIYDNDKMIEEREIFSIIHSKLSKYGFILRYLENREDSTGYTYEPWHFRYIGDKKVSKKIMEENITYEEYLNSIDDLTSNLEACKYKIENMLSDKIINYMYKDKVKNVRYNIKKIYTYKDSDIDDSIKSLKIDKNDVAFEVEYQMEPADESYIKDLTVTSGIYYKKIGWITDISRLGILKYNKKTKNYTIENFGTGW